VHAPGSIAEATEEDHTLRFTARGWPEGPYHLLISGLKSEPTARLNGQPVSPGQDCRYAADEGRLVLRVRGNLKVQLDLH
jgi:hypothetical protein